MSAPHTCAAQQHRRALLEQLQPQPGDPGSAVPPRRISIQIQTSTRPVEPLTVQRRMPSNRVGLPHAVGLRCACVCVHVCVCGPSEVVRVRAWVHTWWAGSKQLAAPTTPSPVHPHTHCHCCPVSVKLLLAGTPRWVIVGPPARPCPPPEWSPHCIMGCLTVTIPHCS